MTYISIIIITLNESERIGRLLTDISLQTYQNYEVIVVDSNSDDDTCQIADSFTNILTDLTVYKMSSRGVCLGRNTGVKLAKYERILFLDADVHLQKDFLSLALMELKEQKLSVAGVYLKAYELSKIYTAGYSIFNVGMLLSQFVFPTAVGACIFSTKSLHTQLDGFDETITLCEDCDYVKRASKLTKFRMLPLYFIFDARRLKQDGVFSTARKYLHANTHRFFIGEIRNNKIKYEFGHYDSSKEKCKRL